MDYLNVYHYAKPKQHKLLYILNIVRHCTQPNYLNGFYGSLKPEPTCQCLSIKQLLPIAEKYGIAANCSSLSSMLSNLKKKGLVVNLDAGWRITYAGTKVIFRVHGTEPAPDNDAVIYIRDLLLSYRDQTTEKNETASKLSNDDIKQQISQLVADEIAKQKNALAEPYQKLLEDCPAFNELKAKASSLEDEIEGYRVEIEQLKGIINAKAETITNLRDSLNNTLDKLHKADERSRYLEEGMRRIKKAFIDSSTWIDQMIEGTAV